MPAIIIPESVEEIGERCFYNCRKLDSVMFDPDSNLRRIEAYAFFGTNLQSITFPKRVEGIGEKCFHNCERLKEITFSRDFRASERVASNAFFWCAVNCIIIPGEVSREGLGIPQDLVLDDENPNAVVLRQNTGLVTYVRSQP
jgi:hypothetical protein